MSLNGVQPQTAPNKFALLVKEGSTPWNVSQETQSAARENLLFAHVLVEKPDSSSDQGRGRAFPRTCASPTIRLTSRGVAPEPRRSRKLVASVDFDNLRPAASTISLW
jgi:hypothetical protein